MTQYLVQSNDGTTSTVLTADPSGSEVTSTKASGPQTMLLDKGPTIGLKYGYSGEVVTGVNYVVDLGPGVGIGRSHT